ncbi:FHA domain-containing protein [Aeromicrobium sp.]|uniref:FHA domain-containing protein n=1 Tax=Aeromicrobium sp. TaxID=1871063 RepID=UPI003C4E02E9
MTAVVHLTADLTFEVDVPSDGERSGGQVRGTVTARGNKITVRSDDIFSVVGQPSRSEVRRVAAGLAQLGLAVEVSGPNGVIVVLGDVRTSPIHRLLTRSRHMRLGHWTQALAAGWARRPSNTGVELTSAGWPPGTPWPPLPTVNGLPRVVTTTHDPAGGGNPRLYIADASDPLMPSVLGVYPLPATGTTIGSGDDVDLHLAGTDTLQAEIIRTDDDEYVLIARSSRMLSTVAGRQLPRQLLRTGARIQMGHWRLSYVRDEFADHGRPYGGRAGGELGRQRTQPRPPNRPGPGF